jgi:uncharacterized protein with von Willebrand factor type A (vWA) domain
MPFEQLAKDLTAAGVSQAAAEEILKNEQAAAALNGWREGGLRQSDYDRKMNSGKAEIEASRTALAEEKARLEADRARINEQYLSALQDREKAATQLATVRAKAKTVSDTYGIEIDKELFGGEQPEPVKPKPAAEASGVPADVDRRLQTVEDLFRNNFEFQAQMLDIMMEHAQLFPEKPLVVKELLDDAMKQRRTPKAVWDDKFGATAKRQDLHDEKIRLEGAAAERAKWEKKISEGAVNPLRMDVPASAIFGLGANKLAQGPRDRGTRAAEAIQRATNALVAHKYAPGQTGVER